MNELPTALGPVAEVLDLAAGFVLCILSGPRDRADSVYLRLVRSLGDELELLRHRIDRQGVDLHELLSDSDGSKPRVVFISGLEQMPDDARREAIVRLNLVRDSWASHPARILLWLPAWGLAEFRRLAPDLFHWRSSLTVLHDADLPVRTEEELLVWTCERFGTRRFAEHRAPQLLRRLPYVAREVFVGYGASERHVLLGHVMLACAASRLRALSATSAFTLIAPDIVAPVYGDTTDLVMTPAPLLVRAADAAGRLDETSGWIEIARAGGIPGPHSAAPVLADLADRVELLVLLDGFDSLAAHSPAHRFVRWLTDTPARLVAFTAGLQPASMTGWSVRPRNPVDLSDARMELFAGSSVKSVLGGLLARLFPEPEDLHLLAAHLFSPELSDELKLGGSRLETAHRFIRILERHGLLDRSFFAELMRMRPHQADEIQAVADQFAVS